MKRQAIKQWVCQFLLLCFGFALLALASAAAQGALAVPLALTLGAFVLLAMNFLCRQLLPRSESPAREPAPRQAVVRPGHEEPLGLRVVRGGHAA